MIKNLCYPKPNRDEYYLIYDFEILLVNKILNRKLDEALKLYDNFFQNKSVLNIVGGDNLTCIKNYISSISLLICHHIIKEGVSPYSAKAKYHAFTRLISKSTSMSELLNIGQDIIQAYTRQLINNCISINNLYIRRAVDYINDNLGEGLTLDMVADYVGLSKCYFCTQFKKELDMNFTDYLNSTRISKSKYLLSNSNKSLLDIGVLVGFNSQSYFTSQFKKYTGISPKEFRENADNRYIL